MHWNKIWHSWLRPGPIPNLWQSDDWELLGEYVKYMIFVTFFTFFPNRPQGHITQPTFMYNSLNDVDSRVDVPFAVKIKTFQLLDPQAPKTAKIWPFWGPAPEVPNFYSKFLLDFVFNGSSKNPLFFIGVP